MAKRRKGRLAGLHGESGVRVVALGICGAYGIKPELIDEVADEIIWAMYRAPGNRAQAAAHVVARKRLARELRVPVRKVPVLHVYAGAIGHYERLLEEYEHWGRITGDAWRLAFDRQSMAFATENGVCPRCGSAGRFRVSGGVCECGFAY